jgi:hypothetical protein
MIAVGVILAAIRLWARLRRGFTRLELTGFRNG